MAKKKGKKTAKRLPKQLPPRYPTIEERRKCLNDVIQKVRALTNVRSKNHKELTEWLLIAGDWLASYSDWECDSQLFSTYPELINLLAETYCALENRFKEMDQKRQIWEDRCSFNLLNCYPKNGIEMAVDEFCRMFDANFENEESVINKTCDNITTETKHNQPIEQVEYNQKPIKEWKLNLNSNIDDQIDNLKQLVDQAYGQPEAKEIRQILIFDHITDKLPGIFRVKVQSCNSLEQCIKILSSILDGFRLKSAQREDQRKLADEYSDLTMIFSRYL